MENSKAAAAFVKAQKGFNPALKTNTNPHFKSRYADLSACVEAVIDALNDNDIALMQPCHETDNGVTVETIFLHASGETISGGKLHVPAVKQDAQGYGSALTYARRYSLMAACGIAPEDDDGNAASAQKQVSAPKNQTPSASAPEVTGEADAMVIAQMNAAKTIPELVSVMNAQADKSLYSAHFNTRKTELSKA